MTPIEAPGKKALWFLSIACLFLMTLNIYLAFRIGLTQTTDSAKLAGHSTAPVIMVLIVIGISCIFKNARNLISLLMIAFITLLLLTSLTSANYSKEIAELSKLTAAIDPSSYTIAPQKAEMLGLRIQTLIEQGKSEEVMQLVDYDRLIKKGLAGQKVTPELKDFARGYTDGMKKSHVFDQIAFNLRQGGAFRFVRYFQKNNHPILQFRWVNQYGGLTYFGMYIFKTPSGDLKIEDLLIYESGASFAEQIIEKAQVITDDPAEVDMKLVDKNSQQLRQLVNERKLKEALEFIETLPPLYQKMKDIQRAKVLFAYEVDLEKADHLFQEYRKTYPGDQSILFLTFTSHLSKGELTEANQLIDEVYRAVDEDEYLFWHIAGSFAEVPNYRETIALLTKMDTQYQIDILQQAPIYLPQEFLVSKEYRKWASHLPVRELSVSEVEVTKI